MADEPRPTNLPITATDLEHRFWTDQLEPSGKPRTSELLEEVPSFSYKDRVVSVSRKDLEALDNYLSQYAESEGRSSIPPRIRDSWTATGKKWHQDLWDRSESIDPNYPLVPVEEDPSQKKPKQTGKVWRGVGSIPLLKKKIFPLVQAAQQVWGTLSDEQKNQFKEFMTDPLPWTGIGKRGIDYFRQMVGLGPEEGRELDTDYTAQTDLFGPEHTVPVGGGIDPSSPIVDLIIAGAKQGQDPNTFIEGMISKGLIPEYARDQAYDYFNRVAPPKKAAGGFIDRPLYDRAV